MDSEVVYDLTQVNNVTNLVGEYKYAMRNALKNSETGEYEMDPNGYILNSDGKKLEFRVVHPSHQDASRQKFVIINALRQTPIEGRCYELFDVRNYDDIPTYSVNVINKTIKDFINFEELRKNIPVFWLKLKSGYENKLLYRFKESEAYVLANSGGCITYKFTLKNFKYNIFDDYIEDQLRAILTSEFETFGNNFKYTKLIFQYKSQLNTKDLLVSVYIQ